VGNERTDDDAGQEAIRSSDQNEASIRNRRHCDRIEGW
jgi:hypothetical protein